MNNCWKEIIDLQIQSNELPERSDFIYSLSSLRNTMLHNYIFIGKNKK